MQAKKLGFGLMRLPLLNPQDSGSIDVEQVKQLVDAFISRGFTYFDTALMYCGGKSEAMTREVLVSRHPRDSFTLATKLHSGYIHTLEDRDRVFNEQMERTGVRYFDYYLLHDINSVSIQTYDRLDCFRWIQEKKRQGLARQIGFSFHDSADTLDRVLTQHPEFDFVQLQLNYLDWDSIGVQSRRCYEVACKHGKPVVVMEPVKGGTLARVPVRVEEAFRACHPDWSAPGWAIRFAASHPNVMLVLSGMGSLAQIEENTRAVQDGVPFGDAERQLVQKAAKIINESVAVPCTGCAYCLDGCPMKINIPRAFSLYNADLQECEGKGWKPQSEYYETMTMAGGKASECIGCGQCEAMCPQHLPIIEQLKHVAAYFE